MIAKLICALFGHKGPDATTALRVDSCHPRRTWNCPRCGARIHHLWEGA